MLFHVVPEDIFRDRALYSRPRYYRRNPRGQPKHLGNMGFLHNVLRPLMVMSHNNLKSENCEGKLPCDTQKCQGVKRRGAKMEERPSKKRHTESITASFDFRGFSADEIKVKATDNAIVVCGRHDDPSNSFRVTRRLRLPPGVDKTAAVCRYTDGRVILEIPASPNHCVEDKPERQEHEKKAEGGEEKTAISDSSRTSDGEDDGGLEIEKEVQAAFQESMKLLSTVFGLPVVERKEKKDVPNGSSEKEEQPAEQTTTDRADPRPEEDNKATAGPLDKQTDVEEEGQKEKGQGEDKCLTLKYNEKPSLRHDPSDNAHVEEQTTGDSTPPEQTTVQNVEEDEILERKVSDGKEDAEKIQIKVNENHPVSSTPQDFLIRLDLSNYKPEDIRVVVRNDDLIVEAEHEKKCDGYSETETLRRCIRLPDKVDQSKLTSVLNAEGELTIQAPFMSQTISGEEEITIPVVW
ncbi:uncharacterized protein [Haliotis asinina]|uniref:uncharacterized protein n=1 Tax=Haliotis asinina TaxID=109174 RepID=UPI0035318110